MGNGWKLGRLFGIDVQVHWSFLLVPLIVLFNNLHLGPEAFLYALTLVLAVFGCVVLHELGHALAARRFGIPTRDITLYPIGGVARLARMPEHPWHEFWIAVAGPAVNVLIAGILFALIKLGGLDFFADNPLAFVDGNFLTLLAWINIIVVLFNMLPAFPSDGGRVLRALLATRMHRVRATEIACTVGIVTALGIALYGLFWHHQLMPAVVAAFLVFAGQQELAAEKHRAWARYAEPLTAVPAVEVLDPAVVGRTVQPPVEGFTGFRWDQTLGAWVYWRDGRPVTVLG